MPNRIIKESICTSDSIDALSWFEEVFFTRLIVNCDDYGRFDARPAVLKARLFPLKERLSLKEISSALQKLSDVDIVRLYECDSKPYLYFTKWEVHQTIRAKRSRYPDPADADEIICKQMQADVPVIQSNPNPNPIRESESEIYSPAEPSRALVAEIVSHLNDSAGTRYKHSSASTTRHINARLNEGYKLDDFIKVIDTKCAEWLDTDMAKYLRPETLFGPKFENYLNQPAGESGNIFFDMAKERGVMP